MDFLSGLLGGGGGGGNTNIANASNINNIQLGQTASGIDPTMIVIVGVVGLGVALLFVK